MNQPVKLHIDLDYKTQTADLHKLNKLFVRLANETIELINKELSDYGIKDPEIIVLKSNQVIDKYKENKVSGHIIYNNIVFEDIYQMKIFFLSLKSDLIDKKIIDKNIYRVGCFRMIGCSKKYKNNKLKFLKGINYQKPNDDNDLFNDSLVTELTSVNPYYVHIQESVKQRIAKKLRLYLSKKTTQQVCNYEYHFTEVEYCKFVKLTASIPVSACDDYIDWFLITFAFSDLYHNISNKDYQIKIYELWDNWCKSSKSYNEDANKLYFDSLNLDYKDANHIPLTCNSKFRFKKYIKYEHIKPILINYKQTSANERFINRQVLLESINKHDIVFIKLPTGTGKTSLLESLFDIKKDGNKIIYKSRGNFKKPIISITSRKNLAKKHSTDLLLDCYDDKNIYLFDCAKLAVTANSLIRVEENNFRDGYVVLDEFSKLVRYYKSRIMDGIRCESYKLVAKIIRLASKIIVLDADLIPNNMDTLLALKVQIIIHFISTNLRIELVLMLIFITINMLLRKCW